MKAGRFMAGRRRWGFTLLELMVVIVLVGVLAAVILPEMRGTYEDALLRAAGRTLAGACQVASSRAVLANQIHQVRLDRQHGRYVIEARTWEAGGPRFQSVPDLPGGAGTWDSRIRVELQVLPDASAPSTEADADPAGAAGQGPDADGAGDFVAFYPDGTADARRILLQDRAGFRLALEINPVTARLHVVEPPVEAPP